MKKLIANLNYISLVLLIVGFALFQTYGKSNLPGVILLALGAVSLVSYFILNLKRLKTKNARLNFIFASNIVIIIILMVGIVGAVNYLGTKIHKRLDFSEGKTHSIADQSIQVAKNLKKDLQIKAFFSEGNSSLFRFRSLVEIYKYYSDRIKVEEIDPFKNPSMVKRYEIRTDGTVILEYDKKDTRLEEISEEALTNAIIKITRPDEKTIYFTEGHGEPDINNTEDFGYYEVKSNLEKLSYKVKSIKLFEEMSVPSDASVLVVAGPKSPLMDREIQRLDDYIFHRNGRVFFLINPSQGEELKPLLQKLGVELENTVVIEPKDELTIALTGADHFTIYSMPQSNQEIVKNFKFVTLFPFCRSVRKLSPSPKDVNVETVITSGKNSWAATNYEEMASVKKIIQNPADRRGPVELMLAVQLSGSANQNARVVVSGSADFAGRAYYNTQRGANGNLFNNVISWLANEGDLIAIAPKTTSNRMINLSPADIKLIFFYTIFILPLLVMIAGIGIWLYRRKL